MGDLMGVIVFEGDGAELPSDASPVLLTVMQTASLAAPRPILLSPYYQGESAKSVDLAQRRAAAVRDALRMVGVDPARIQVQRAMPSAGGGSERDGRRVELRLGS
jgi:hypothetical protein